MRNEKIVFSDINEVVEDYERRFNPRHPLKWWVAQEPLFDGDAYTVAIGEEVEGQLHLENLQYYKVLEA